MDVKDVELRIKLAQLEKLQGVLVKKEEVAKQFATFYNLLWHYIDETIIDIANNISNKYNCNFDELVNYIRERFYQIKENIENGKRVE